MDHNTLDVPELQDLLNKIDAKDTSDRHFLPDEVRFANLRVLNDANLEGRYAYYLRDYTFEMNPSKRAEFYREVLRTKFELKRRIAEKRAAVIAEALPAALPGDIVAANDAGTTFRAAA